ncbi:zf-HC2 domain-containing protein [uncultured Friedmanniella sp.]|uniref:zf-HC2 domain-containing protein n=1 Tax=uncultured Friedmanniella sp. TaxID=335381 RepID=UPI0035CA3861
MSSGKERFEPPGSDPYASWDAAYVLGALAPAERLEFEEHLAGCAACRSGVAEIAGLPGLLAQVDPEDAARLTEAPSSAAGSPEPGAPVGVLPRVLASARRRTRLTRALVGTAAAVILLLAVGLGVGLLRPASDPARRLAFSPVEPTTITAVVDVVPLAQGTQLDVECQYGGEVYPGPAGEHPEYSIVVIDRAGRSSSVKDWPVSTNKVMHPSGTTPLKVSDIRDVEIRATATDETVLRASLR